MSDYVTDEMVETAARAMDHAYNPDRAPILAAMFRDYARAALEAAAPLIAAQALRDAEDAWQWGEWAAITEPAKRPAVPSILGTANAVTDWIRARADRIEKED